MTQEIYDAYNNLIFAKELKVVGKLLYRYNFFKQVINLPGDIVELGVFKGSGMAAWLKFIQLHIPNTNKKVVGFDIFNHTEETNKIINNYKNGELLHDIINRVDKNELTFEAVKNRLSQLSDKFILVQGDIKETTRQFSFKNPGFRICLLYIDLDLAEPTYYALLNLWDKIIPGGFIIFDEYDFHNFDESNGVDRFLKEYNIGYEIYNTNFISPTSFMIKKN